MIYLFRDVTHPEADGREPQAGDAAFAFDIALEDHGTLKLEMGEDGFTSFAALVLEILSDNDDMRRIAKRKLRQLRASR